ncbi:MAG: mannose-1-phosphate guanylyltransferase, partial [Bacteroides sp.]|nr:mannose-1-phosphate guanylyltransferase [Bacteroides sp.]
MAGGIGSRFWPLSTPDRPKQFIDILGWGRTLLQLTADRFKNICSYENIWIVTSSNYKHFIKEQLPQIPEENILEEPCRRNTAPCIAYVNWKIYQTYPDANIIVSPSDHIVTDVYEFERIIRLALHSVTQLDHIITLGIQPTRPDTGYSYIEAKTEENTYSTQEIFPVKAFKEKPSLKIAKGYIQQNNFFWNAGIFIWNINTIINSLKIYQKEIATIFEKVSGHFYTDQEQEKINEYFPLCPNISIDYAVLEKADNIY